MAHAHNTADILRILIRKGLDSDGIGDVAVGDEPIEMNIIKTVAHDAADIPFPGDYGIVEGEVLHLRCGSFAATDVAEYTLAYIIWII